jgi:hypothetical protein
MNRTNVLPRRPNSNALSDNTRLKGGNLRLARTRLLTGANALFEAGEKGAQMAVDDIANLRRLREIVRDRLLMRRQMQVSAMRLPNRLSGAIRAPGPQRDVRPEQRVRAIAAPNRETALSLESRANSLRANRIHPRLREIVRLSVATSWSCPNPRKQQRGVGGFVPLHIRRTFNTRSRFAPQQ